MSRSDDHPDAEPRSNVTSLDDARRRALERQRREQREAKRTAAGAMSGRDWLVGGAALVMALGCIAYYLAPLFGTGLTR